jgi:ABC-type nitrate/sulfonate/bicarbonate transport system substrate-binding protein
MARSETKLFEKVTAHQDDCERGRNANCSSRRHRVQVGSTNTRLAAISKGVVEATVLTPEFYLLAKKAGSNALADPISTKIDFPQNGIAASRGYLKSRPDVVNRYLLANIEPIHFFKTRPEESVQIMTKYLKITRP